jgi:hypothetical protein
VAALLGLGGQGRRPGCAELAAGLLAEPGQGLGLAALGLRVAAGPASPVDLAPPVGVDEERAGVHRLLGGGAPPVAGHVAGGHRDQVGPDAQLVERAGDAAGAEQVDLDRGVEGRVEGHGGGRVDHDVTRGKDRPAVVVQAEAVRADVAGDDGDPAPDHLVERRRAHLPAQAVEGVVAEDLPAGPLGDRGPLAGADEQHELAARHRPQQPFDQRGAEEAGAAGDGDAAAVECLGDHAHLSTIW